MKNRLPVIVITAAATFICMLAVIYVLYNMKLRSVTALSNDSPDGTFIACVIESPSMDPPNQSLFIERKGSQNFRLVEELPEDIEFVEKIFWSPDGKIAVFATNWNLVIAGTESLNVTKISLNNDWWTKNKNGTFSTSGENIKIQTLDFIGLDSLVYSTNNMPDPVFVDLSFIN